MLTKPVLARHRAADRKWYAANSERSRAKSKAWKSAHPDRVRAQSKAWREANLVSELAREKSWREAHPGHSKAWRIANLERSRANGKAWRKTHPTQWRALRHNNQARRRARIARVLATLTAQEWEAVLATAGHACIYCGSNERISQDHLTPISRGGPHTSENVAPACLPCNLSKGAKTVMEFLAEEE